MSLATCLAGYRDSIAALESIVTIAALAVGGWWTWIAFIRKRVAYPSADIAHDAKIWRTDDRTFVHLAVRIANCGSVLMRVEAGCAWVEQLEPLPESVRNALENGNDFVPTGRVDAQWSMLTKRTLPDGFVLEIEPGETDQVDFDFSIDPRVRRVLIYSHLTNPKKETSGWNLNTIHEIPSANRR